MLAKGKRLSSGRLIVPPGMMSRKDAVDEGIGGAKVIDGIEEAIEFGGSERGGHVVFRGEDIAQMAIFELSAAAGGFDAFVGSVAAEICAQRHGGGFSEDETTRGIEVFAHAAGVNYKMRSDRGEMVEAARGEAHDFRKG